MRLFLLFTIFIFSCPTLAEESAIDQRIEQEKELQHFNFSLIPHKPTYILPIVYNSNIQSYDFYPVNENGENEFQELEMKFQLSLKVPVFVEISGLPLTVYFAYTQVSFWQAYNSEKSSPFRETNYEPELFATWHKGYQLPLGWAFKFASFGFTHQSNGRSEPLSRSWNRLNGNLVFEKSNLAIAFNPWYRFDEPASKDNNPDLIDYYGHGKITFAYKINDNTFSLMSRNNLESGFSKGALEASWSFQIHNKVRGYLQVFSGYGNSMVEYDQYTNTIGLGISLTDWL
jgi:phospholipase A1